MKMLIVLLMSVILTSCATTGSLLKVVGEGFAKGAKPSTSCISSITGNSVYTSCE